LASRKAEKNMVVLGTYPKLLDLIVMGDFSYHSTSWERNYIDRLPKKKKVSRR